MEMLHFWAGYLMVLPSRSSRQTLSSKPLLLSGRNRTLENAPGSSQSKRVINSETFDLLAGDLNFGHLRFLRMVISWIRQSFRGFDRLLTQSYGRLSRRRHSCPKDVRGLGVDLASARHDKGVILSEPGFA